MLEIIEHVEAGTTWREQNHITRKGLLEGQFHRLFHVLGTYGLDMGPQAIGNLIGCSA